MKIVPLKHWDITDVSQIELQHFKRITIVHITLRSLEIPGEQPNVTGVISATVLY